MKIAYGILVMAEIILLGICSVQAFRRKGILARATFAYELSSFICGIVFAAYIFVPGNMAKTLCAGLTYAIFDWIIIALMYYSQHYTGLFRGVRPVKILMYVYSAFDTVMMISNAWTHKVFYIDNISADSVNVVIGQASLVYKAHFIYIYIGIIVIMLAYLMMIIKSSRFYRFRYEMILLVLAVSFTLDIVTIGNNSIYDLSTPVFSFMAILIYYLTFKYVPNEVIENMLSLIIKDMNDGIVCFDNRGRCIYSNDVADMMYTSDGLHGSKSHEDFEAEYREWLEKHRDTRRDYMKYDIPVTNAAGSKFYEVEYKRINDEKNNHICDYFIVNDISEVIAKLEREKYKASHDSLTGLLNREQFYEETRKILRNNPDRKYSIICSNIRDFKFINELFGIEKGNKVLIRQSELMKEYQHNGDLCARMQNDRFAMLVPSDHKIEEHIISCINLMQEEFKSSLFRLHIFAGIYEIDDTDEPVSIMCDKANIASETIKNSYQKYFAYYNNELLERSIEERRIIGEFEKAIDNNEFVMFLQPQVDCKGMTYGAEALVRWQHPERGLLSPAVFIDVLEKAGLIYKLDRYMWEKAAEKLGEWKREGHDRYHISVNISTKDFYLIDVYETFTGLVDKYNINPDKLKLEITETALMADFKKNMEIIRRLQNYGFKIEIDDFGSGYSSLNMLKDISADVLKIDMGFLRASENELKGRDILESIVSLAGKLGMEVITEGVEKESQVNMLKDMGCNMFQGYFFSKPVQIKEFEDRYLI